MEDSEEYFGVGLGIANDIEFRCESLCEMVSASFGRGWTGYYHCILYFFPVKLFSVVDSSSVDYEPEQLYRWGGVRDDSRHVDVVDENCNLSARLGSQKLLLQNFQFGLDAALGHQRRSLCWKHQTYRIDVPHFFYLVQ